MQPKQWLDLYASRGWSFFNSGSKEKKVFTKWAEYQTRKPTAHEIESWLRLTSQNYGIVCGEISNLVVFDVDTKNGGDPSPFLNRGLYEVRTPSGGYHFYTTYNTLLASTKHKKAKHDGILFAVDVQSNGSMVFAPPTQFPQGEYTITNDVPIGPLPDDLFIQVLSSLKPEEKVVEYTPFQPIKTPENGRPGDIFNALATWEDVLSPFGWTKVGQHSTTTYWRRPGKRDGISATTNHKGYDLLFVFSSSTPLDPQKGYTKFNTYATLNHGGDFKKAAKALVIDNYKLAVRRI